MSRFERSIWAASTEGARDPQMSKPSYRSAARASLKRAEAELTSGEDDRLRYAALELRMAIESLAYERVLKYRDELPKSALDIWQPRQVMDALLEIDPMADKTSTLSYAKESSPGVRSGPMRPLGTDRVISMKEIKKYYAKLDSYLHPPTIGQFEAGKVARPDRIRQRCEEVARIVQESLASTVHNVNLRQHATIECYRCDAPIIRRMPPTGDSTEATCPSCGARYSVTRTGVPSDRKVEWLPIGVDVPCPHPQCDEVSLLFEDEVRPGASWKCLGCEEMNQLGLSVRLMDQNQEETTDC